MPRIDPDRLLADLATLRSFGAHDSGVVRPSLSAIDLEARHWLKGRMSDAGLRAEIDGVGNVVGRSPNSGPALLIGSHSDTQPRGGWLDGALGVIYGLEVARALRDDPSTAGLAVDAVAWIDEEATFLSCLGSRAFCGLVDQAEVDAAIGPEGLRLTDAFDRAGLAGLAGAARFEPGRHIGYLEGHIEQGANLEHDDLLIGVVSSIVGIRNFDIVFHGQQNHAGSTPMPRRRDAGLAMLRFGAALHERFAQLAGPQTVWTMGRMAVDPGAPSIIPGRAELHLQFRDPDRAMLERLVAVVESQVAAADGAGPVGLELVSGGTPIDPAEMDLGLQEHLARAAAEHAPHRWRRMPSAAVHDAMFVAAVMPSGMLFVPSIDGISHDFAENTADEDIVRGAQVMAAAAAGALAGYGAD